MLLGIGNPLLDISACVTPEYLEKHCLGADNAILAEEKHLPIFNEIQTHYNPDYIAGYKKKLSHRLTYNSIKIFLAAPCKTRYACVNG